MHVYHNIRLSPCTEPCGYPPGIKITDVTPLSITYEWGELECFQRNGVIQGYQIGLNLLGEEVLSLIITGSETTTFTFWGLTEVPHNYSFSIAAFNQVGVGDFSPPLHAGEHNECTWREIDLRWNRKCTPLYMSWYRNDRERETRTKLKRERERYRRRGRDRGREKERNRKLITLSTYP